MKTEKGLHWTFGLELVDLCVECGKPAAGHHHLSDDAEAIVKALRAEKPEPVAEHLSLKALALHSGLSVRKLRTLIAAPVDAIPHHRIGGRVLVKRADFDQWAAQHRRVGNTIEEKIDRLQKRGRKGDKPPRPRPR